MGTRGVVNKLNAKVDQYQDAIQTDATIDPWNTGGPLVNMNGEVVGINTATPRQTTGTDLAISMTYARPIIDQLLQGKKLNNVGWNLVPNDTEIASQHKLATDKGIVVAGVDADSPASRAGLEPLDIIYEMAGIRVTDNRQICDIIRSHKPGDPLEINIVRGTMQWSGELNGRVLTMVRDLAAPTFPPVTIPLLLLSPALPPSMGTRSIIRPVSVMRVRFAHKNSKQTSLFLFLSGFRNDCRNDFVPLL